MKYFHGRMNIFKWSRIIPVLFKQITKIFGENYLSLWSYNADQFWFLKIKSLPITLTHGNFPASLHPTRRELVGFPSASAASSCKLGAHGGVSTFKWHHSWPPRACEWIRGIRDTGAVIRSTIPLQGSRIRSHVAARPSQLGFLATISLTA